MNVSRTVEFGFTWLSSYCSCIVAGKWIRCPESPANASRVTTLRQLNSRSGYLRSGSCLKTRFNVFTTTSEEALVGINVMQDVRSRQKERKKQKVYLPQEPDSKGKREAITEYRILEEFQDYTLVEVWPKTGRKHQIRCHFSYLGHPIAGDKRYGFKNQPCPKGLSRHFLHASYLNIKLPDGENKEFFSPLPKDLKDVLKELRY